MSEFQTGYQALGPYYDDEDTDTPPTENIMVHVAPDVGKARWNHIENLDEFFTRVYHYHQRNGFACMMLQDVLQLAQFIFVVLFSAFLMKCVDYPVLFGEKKYDGIHKVTIPEAIIPLDQCVQSFNPALVICLVIALLFWLLRLIKVIYNIFKYMEIKAFYTYALKISADDVSNMTWHEVQRRLLEVQKEQQMCIHKQELSQLDIYHRILRFKNYMIAMVNKSLLPLKFKVPFIGEYAFLSEGLKYNLEMILFWGPYSPFENNWHLRPEYKQREKRKELADSLSRRILWLGVANFLLCPVIFLWQILYSFFRYAEVLKREPGTLGARKWSNYARLYLRHFNELDHEFFARLNRGYRPATRYMNIFTSPLLVVVAKNVAFFAGSVLAVLIILTVIDEDVLSVQHVLTTMTCLGLVVTASQLCIPDEHMVWCPETLMRQVLAQIHYMPDSWKGNAHTFKVREEFGQLFQYRALFLVEELLSPIITPIILCFGLRDKALPIIDFFHNFTVDVVGVGDVCSFAQMDIRRHGNPRWVDEGATQANNYHQAEDGKTELSLMHFTLTNPEWKPPDNCSMFLHTVKEHAQKDVMALSTLPENNPLLTSLHSMSSIGAGYNSIVSSVIQQSAMPPLLSPGQMPPPGGLAAAPGTMPLRAPGINPLNMRGSMAHVEGPLMGSATTGLLSSIHNSGGGGGGLSMSGTAATGPVSGPQGLLQTPDGVTFSPDSPQGARAPVGMATSAVSGAGYNEGTLEFLSAEMSLSALYLHELHHKRMQGPFYFDDVQSRAIWNRTDGNQQSAMPSIQEEGGIPMTTIPRVAMAATLAMETDPEETNGRLTKST